MSKLGEKTKTYRVIFYGENRPEISLVQLFSDQDQALDSGIQTLWVLAPGWDHFKIWQIKNLHMFKGVVHTYHLKDEPK